MPSESNLLKMQQQSMDRLKASITAGKAHIEAEKAQVAQAEGEIEAAKQTPPSLWDSKIVQWSLFAVGLTFIGMQIFGKKGKKK